MKEGFYAVIAFTAVVALSGCGGGSSSGGDGADNNGESGNNGSVDGAANGADTTVLPTAYRGTWRQPCYEEEGEYINAVYEFSANQIVRDERYYEDAACTVAPDRFYHLITTFSVVVYSQTVSTSYGAAYAVDITSTAAEVDGEVLDNFPSGTEYDLLLLQGDGLHFGYDDGSNFNIGETAADRPTDIDPSPLLIR